MATTRTWFMVAHRASAKLFEREGARALTQLLDIEHPRGRMKSGEINADRWGRAFARVGTGSSSSMEKSHSPVRHEAEVFAKEVAQVLNTAAKEDRFDKLVLIAESRFLGLLRDELDNETRARVVLEEAKDLAAAGEAEIKSALEALAA